MQKVVVFFIAVIFLMGTTSFIPINKTKVNWLTLNDMAIAYAKAPKPILVDLYTDWCGWCKVMDKDTYSNTDVVAYINEHYYAVKFNAEIKDTVIFNGKKYGYNAQNRANDLAVFLAYGKMSYPTTVFLSAVNAQPAPLPGYLKAKEIEPYLKFFGDGAYKSINFPMFMKNFKSNW